MIVENISLAMPQGNGKLDFMELLARLSTHEPCTCTPLPLMQPAP
jgi:hypothetical protein